MGNKISATVSDSVSIGEIARKVSFMSHKYVEHGEQKTAKNGYFLKQKSVSSPYTQHLVLNHSMKLDYNHEFLSPIAFSIT